jgi:glycosyltransferase involved in cell wall biosynthesis
MAEQKKLLSVVVPIFFEEQVIGEFYRRTHAALQGLTQRYAYEIVFVDDGSKDHSLPLLLELAKQDPCVRVLTFSRNFGHQMAITAGIEHAAGEAIVLIDGDLQDPPELIPEMVAKWEEGYKVVYAMRETREGENFVKLATAKAFYKVLNMLSEIEIPSDTGDFRLMDRQVADALMSLPECNRFIRGLIPWVGFPQYGLKYRRDARYAGSTKFSLEKMLKFAFSGITSFSEKPLYLALRFGVFFSLLSFLLGVWLVVNKLLFSEDTIFGWTSLVIVILFVGGVQLLSVGVLGLYIGKIYHEVKRRPLYIAAAKYGFPETTQLQPGHQTSCNAEI